MEASCLRQTDLPHTSRLFSDFLYHFDRVKHFYEDGRRAGDFPDGRRAALISALAEQNEPSESLRRLAEPGTVAVVTGQQVGFLSGPAYTIYKALTAVKLARDLSARGQPAVPVFWLATEDHDFAEVNHAWVFDPTAHPTRIDVAAFTSGDKPVGTIAIESWNTALLQDSLRELPFGDEVIALVEDEYVPGRTMGEAFHRLLHRLLSRFGLLFIDPLRESVRTLAAPLLREAVETAPELNRLLLERNHELGEAGYHAQVHLEPSTSLFFLLDGARRVALKRQNGDYVAKDRRYSAAELANMAEHLSPNALLRPVVQDYILPTTAYIGGPAELAYLAQSQVLYRTLIGGMPRPVPRSGFTLVDQRSAKLMERYALQVPDFFHGEEALRQRMAEQLVPPSLQAQFQQTNAEIGTRLDRLHASVSDFDPTLGATTAKSRAKIMHQLHKIEAKAARESMRRSDRAAADAAYLYGNIFPHKHLQERFYSILPFLARHGFDLIDSLYDGVHLDCSDHIVARLDN
jgi:bacillithiol biosynthesis cysteine-adding enzyme BshC